MKEDLISSAVLSNNNMPLVASGLPRSRLERMDPLLAGLRTPGLRGKGRSGMGLDFGQEEASPRADPFDGSS